MKIGALALVAVSLLGGDWARFRGPNGSGVSDARGLPVELKSVWKTAAPFGRSSPIVVRDRVFVTASEGGKLLTLAYDTKTGRELWRRVLAPSALKTIYKANDPAAPTPVSDGSFLYVYFDDFGLVSYSLDGVERWRMAMPPTSNFYGMGTSPIVANGLVVLLCDQVRGSFVLAVDAATGKQKWRRERPDSPDGWSAPVVYKDQLILAGSTRVDSLQLATGEVRWWFPLLSNGAMGSPVIHGDRLIVTALGMDAPWMPSFESAVTKLDKDKDGMISKEEAKDEKDWIDHFPWVDLDADGKLTEKEWEKARQFGVGEYGAVSLPLDGRGRVEASAVRWRLKRNLPYVPSALLYDGVFYMVKSGGIVTSVDPSTGSILKQGRTPKALGEYYASPVAGDGKIYSISEAGVITVFKAGAQWDVLAVHETGDEAYATPAVVDGGLIVRTRGQLQRFGAK